LGLVTHYDAPFELVLLNNTGQEISTYGIPGGVYGIESFDSEGDGIEEFAIASYWSSSALKWYNRTSLINDTSISQYMYTILIGDVNNDSKDDLVGVGFGGRAYATDVNGTLLWNNTLSGEFREGSIADLDGDLQNEVILVSERVYVLYGENGTVKWNTSNGQRSVNLIDLTRDGEPTEIIYSTGSTGIYATNQPNTTMDFRYRNGQRC